MNANARRNAPSWRLAEVRSLRPELWCIAVAIVGMLLVEVWQAARMTESSLALDRTRSALMQERSRLEFDRASLERGATRSELDPLARGLGLLPVDAHRQQIDLPGDFLARDSRSSRSESASLVAWLDRITGAIVPEATARSRSGNRD